MNSIKSLATLMILAMVGGYLYLKITETEPVLPPEAADLSYDVPQIDLGGDAEALGFAPPADVVGESTAFGPSTGATVAPPYDPSLAESAAPPWSSPPSNPPTAAAGPSDVTAVTAPPPIALPSGTPPGVEANPSPANPFDRAPESPATTSLPVGTAGEVTPNSTTLPPPGSLGLSQETVIEGRVYDEPEAETPAPQPSTPTVNPPPYVSAIPDSPAVSAVSTGPNLPVPLATSSIETALQRVVSLLSQRQLAEALRLLTEYHRDPSLSPDEQKEVDLLLSQLAGTVIYSTGHELEPPHRVAPGETLAAIADRFNVPAELLAKINGIADPSSLTPGTELKVVRGPFLAIVDLTHRELTLLLSGRYAGRFPIQIGTDQPPIEGQWVVAKKQYDPEYIGAQQMISGGDLSNPLGGQILVLASPTGEAGEFGIHGSPLGGENDSRGSIRLSSADANDIFDILSVGSKVIVRR